MSASMEMPYPGPVAAASMAPAIAAARRVLLVEDNVDSRTVYRLVLEHSRYRVLEARSGAEAIRLAREALPDLILMDISIPDIDGWEATRILKADASTAHIPILALTAHALESDRVRSMDAGCDGFLAKPAAPRLVLAEVFHWIGHAEPPPA